MPLRLLCIGPEGQADLVDRDGHWQRLSQVSATGAVLVRPDGHVAWRCTDVPAEAAETLGAVLVRLQSR